MRKIALLVALALIISVGGVYATWRYSTLAVSDFEYNLSDALSITLVDTTDSAKGSIAAPNSLRLTIDDDNGDHKPDWDADIANETGSLTVKFTPNVGASNVTLKYYITLSNYDYTCPVHGANQKIFNPTEDKDTTIDGFQILSGELEYTGGTAAVEVNYTAAQIQAALNLNTNLSIDSINEYNAYSEAVGNVKLVLCVEEVTATLS